MVTKEELEKRLNDIELDKDFSCKKIIDSIDKEELSNLYEKFVEQNLWNFDHEAIFKDNADENEIKEAEENGYPIYDDWSDYWTNNKDDYITCLIEGLEQFTSPIDLIANLRSISNKISEKAAIISGFMSNYQYNEFREIYRDATIFDFSV